MKELSERARALVDQAREDLEPSADDEARTKAALLARIALPLAAGAAVTAAATGSAGAAGAAGTATVGAGVGVGLGVKLVVGSALLVAAAGGAAGLYAVSGPDAAPATSAPAAPASDRVPAAAPATSAPSTLDRFLPVERDTAPAEGPSATRPRTGIASTDTGAALNEEVSLVAEAHGELNEGRAEGALDRLARLDDRFPSGTLMPERTALRAIAECALGRGAAGRAYLEALEKLSPRHPMLDRARATCAAADAKP